MRLAHRREALLFDCGDLHQLVPRDALKITTLFISHAHIDHRVGFDALLRTFLYHDRTLLAYGPTDIIKRIRGRLTGYTWNLIEGCLLVLKVRERQGRPKRHCSEVSAGRAAQGKPVRAGMAYNGGVSELSAKETEHVNQCLHP